MVALIFPLLETLKSALFIFFKKGNTMSNALRKSNFLYIYSCVVHIIFLSFTEEVSLSIFY